MEALRSLQLPRLNNYFARLLFYSSSLPAKLGLLSTASAVLAMNSSANNNELPSLNLDDGGGGNDDDDDLADGELRSVRTEQLTVAPVGRAAAVATQQKMRLRKSSLRCRWLVLGLVCIVMTGFNYA